MATEYQPTRPRNKNNRGSHVPESAVVIPNFATNLHVEQTIVKFRNEMQNHVNNKVNSVKHQVTMIEGSVKDIIKQNDVKIDDLETQNTNLYDLTTRTLKTNGILVRLSVVAVTLGGGMLGIAFYLIFK